MLKALFLLLMDLALAGMATAQVNLVLNGSFEDTVDCDVPTQCTLLKAMHWFNPTLCTPDLYDCDLDRVCGSPMDLPQFQGFMLSLDGLRHSGEYFWYGAGSSNAREYQMVKLAAPLQMDEAYEVSLWYARRRSFQRAVDHIGVWFGQDSLWQATTDWLAATPQVRLRDPNSEYLANADDWTRLVDTLVAAGGEQWMVIGNFDPADSVNGTVADPDGIYPACYYWIDSVMVRLLSEMSVPETRPTGWWSGDGITIRWEGQSGPIRLTLWDATGRLVVRSTITMPVGRGDLPLPWISDGAYVLNLETTNKRAAVVFIK